MDTTFSGTTSPMGDVTVSQAQLDGEACVVRGDPSQPLELTMATVTRACDYCGEPPGGLVVGGDVRERRLPRVAVGHDGCYRRHLDLLCASRPASAAGARR